MLFVLAIAVYCLCGFACFRIVQRIDRGAVYNHAALSPPVVAGMLFLRWPFVTLLLGIMGMTSAIGKLLTKG